MNTLTKKPSIFRPLRLAATSLLMLCATACGSAPSTAPATPATPATAPKSATETLWQQIQTANADTTCDSDSQCHTIGAGSRACGGPERYLPWSAKHGDGAELKRLVEQHAAARRADDQRAGMMSTCSMVSDPGASCRAGHCVVNPTAPFGSGGNRSAQ